LLPFITEELNVDTLWNCSAGEVVETRLIFQTARQILYRNIKGPPPRKSSINE